MSTATATATAATASYETTLTPETVRAVLAAYQDNPGSEVARQEALACRRDVAAQIAALPSAQKSGPGIERAREWIKLFGESGLPDNAASAEDLGLACEYRAQSWPGLLAATLLVPAWQWPEAPALNEVPQWLWVDYAQYLFYTPQGFTAIGQADAYAAHALRRLEELAKLAATNRGSSAVRAALTVYRRMTNCIPLYFTTGALRRHFELRGQILKIAVGVGANEPMFPRGREARKLRVGFVSRHFGRQTETFTTLPTFEELDPERFEVHLFALEHTNSAVEMHACHRVAAFSLLSGTTEEQVAAIRSADLDVLVFGANLTAVCNGVVELALHRLAPLQVVNNSSCVTSGLPEIDLYVSGDQIGRFAPEDYTERLAILPGPAHTFDYEPDKQERSAQWTRESLGMPADAVVFVTAANYYKIIPEMQHAWARLLASVPGSRLLIHPFNPNWASEYPIKRFSAEFDRVLAKHGVDGTRLLISAGKFDSRADVKALLRVGDIYLDTFPFAGVNSLVDPLECGIPVVTWEGETFRSRMGSALLRSIGLEECIAQDEASYLRICLEFATSCDRRVVLRDRINAAIGHLPCFLDPLAASDGFGALLEHAFDALAADGSEVFRGNREPLRIALPSNSDAALDEAEVLLQRGLANEAEGKVRGVLNATPTSYDARWAMGRILAALQRPVRAVDYLLAAVQQVDGNANLWLDLSRALLQSGRRPQAVEALEACIRIDEKHIEGWLFMGQLARESSNYDLLQQIIDILRELAPYDPRVGRLISGSL